MGENKQEKRRTANWVARLFICLSIILIIALSVNIYITNRQYEYNFKPISTSKQVNNPLKDLKPDSTKTYKLSENDLKQFNDHIDYLTEKTQTEVDRTQKNTEYDIDRINTFLAIGLALLAIFGGLLPLVVNFFSKELIESKIESHATVIKECQDNIKSANDNATKAKEDAGKALRSMQGFEGRIKTIETGIGSVEETIIPISNIVETAKIEVAAITKKIPFISSLVLQNAVARLLSVSNIRYYTESNRYKKLSKVLEGIISGMDLCKNDGFHNHEDENYKFLIDVITDLKIGFQFSTFRLNLDRKFQKEIDEFSVYLDNFKFENKDQFKNLLGEAAIKLAEIKNGIDNIKS